MPELKIIPKSGMITKLKGSVEPECKVKRYINFIDYLTLTVVDCTRKISEADIAFSFEPRPFM